MSYFVYEIEFNSKKAYITSLITTLCDLSSVVIKSFVLEDRVKIYFENDEQRVKEFLEDLGSILPASLYLKEGRFYQCEEILEEEEVSKDELPIDLALCPTCQKEIFDISSNRYYYPFTSCKFCGPQHSFLDKYPYSRENSSLKFLQPCPNCQDELEKNPLRRDYPLISCLECGISIKIDDKKSTRYANDKGSYKQLFEVCAKALSKGKTILIKGTFGYRLYSLAQKREKLSNLKLMICDASKLNTHLMLIPQEFNALLSIERPILRVATKSQELKELFGNAIKVKYPDDGMSILLAKELLNLGIDYICYKDCGEDEDSDLRVDYDIPINSQNDFELFINQDLFFKVKGERTIFPSKIEKFKKNRVVIANSYFSNDGVIDKESFFDSIKANEVYIKKGEKISVDIQNLHYFDGYKASMLSVLAEHGLTGKSAVGVHFDDRLYFLFYNKKEVISVIPPNDFDSNELFKQIKTLREGSDRLVENFRKKYPSIYKKLDKKDKNRSLFEIVSMILDLESKGFDAISEAALEFMGKGGVLIDTKIENNRFNDYAFIASIMSYKLTGADSSLIAYSIFESFGDYMAEIVNQLMEKSKSQTLTLSGESFANQALWARIKRNLAHKNPLLNIHFPIGQENQVYGGGFF